MASLALSKLAVFLDEASTAAAIEAANAEMESYGRASGSSGITDGVQEVDAGELFRTSSKEAEADAVRIGKAGEGAPPKVEQVKVPVHGKSASEGVAGPSTYGGAAAASAAKDGDGPRTDGANKEKGGCLVM